MKAYRLLPLAVTLSAMFGCSGGGSVPISGTLVDGYVSNATVVCDTNSSGTLELDEMSTTTNAKGDFTFTPQCEFPIYAFGGTNIDTGLPLVGVLKAPANSTMVTPLTSLVASGMTPAQVATALGLPAGTDVTTANPIGNPELQAKTLVVQQIMQKTAEMMASLAGTTDVSGIYAGVASAVADTLMASGTPLIDATGTVNSTVVSASVSAAVTEVGTTIPAIAALDPTNVAAVSSTAITSMAQSLADATTTDAIVAMTLAQQSDTSLVDNITLLAPLLTDEAAAQATGDLTAALTTVGGLLETALTGSVDTATITTAVTTADSLTNADTSTLVVPVLTPTNYLALNDSITLGGVNDTLVNFAQTGVAVPGTSFAVLNVSFNFSVTGTVVDDPATAAVETTKVVQVAAEINDPSSSHLMQVMIDQVELTQSGSTLSATLPSGAKAQVYAVNKSGAATSITLSNLATNAVSITGSTMNLDLGTLLTNAFSSLTAAQQQVLTSAMATSGTFDAKMVINKIDLRDTAAVLLSPVSVISTGNTAINVVGLGVTGHVTR